MFRSPRPGSGRDLLHPSRSLCLGPQLCSLVIKIFRRLLKPHSYRNRSRFLMIPAQLQITSGKKGRRFLRPRPLRWCAMLPEGGPLPSRVPKSSGSWRAASGRTRRTCSAAGLAFTVFNCTPTLTPMFGRPFFWRPGRTSPRPRPPVKPASTTSSLSSRNIDCNFPASNGSISSVFCVAFDW